MTDTTNSRTLVDIVSIVGLLGIIDLTIGSKLGVGARCEMRQNFVIFRIGFFEVHAVIFSLSTIFSSPKTPSEGMSIKHGSLVTHT